QFVEINATGFRKILKKWDKRSKSSTKELYLSRQLQNHTQGLTTTPSSRSTSPGRRLSVGESTEPDVMDDLETELFMAIMKDATSTVQEILGRILHHQIEEDKDILSRVFWRVCSEKNSSIDSIQCLVNTNMVNFKYFDDISDRTCLHEAAIVGRLPLITLCVDKGAKVDCSDVYGRRPLHYVCMYGHSDAATYLLSQKADFESLDHDVFSPLIYAVTNGHTKCVEILLKAGARIEPQGEDGHSHIPLSLACEYGHEDIAMLLLEKGAQIRLDAEGLSPLHLTSREGHHKLLKILTEQGGALLNTPDKYKGWTPIFYAASEGNIECVNILIQANCQVDISDESGHSPIYYAAWEGHIECINKLREAGGRAEIKDEPSNMIITNGIIPHNIILPLGDDREVFSFQTDTLNKFSLEFDIFPTFGSKVIGKGVALPHVFNFTSSRERRNHLVIEGTGGKCICPLFDTHLKVVGELSFEFAVVKPFQGVQLEIGGQVETYWKSTNTVSLPGSVSDQSSINTG
ncbi:18159_t:CDS:2, partial [Racocetra fulgida]